MHWTVHTANQPICSSINCKSDKSEKLEYNNSMQCRFNLSRRLFLFIRISQQDFRVPTGLLTDKLIMSVHVSHSIFHLLLLLLLLHWAFACSHNNSDLQQIMAAMHANLVKDSGGITTWWTSVCLKLTSLQETTKILFFSLLFSPPPKSSSSSCHPACEFDHRMTHICYLLCLRLRVRDRTVRITS